MHSPEPVVSYFKLTRVLTIAKPDAALIISKPATNHAIVVSISLVMLVAYGRVVAPRVGAAF